MPILSVSQGQPVRIARIGVAPQLAILCLDGLRAAHGGLLDDFLAALAQQLGGVDGEAAFHPQLVGVHWWWKRGADAASAGFMPWSMALLTVCSTVVMMRAPPGLPVTSQGLPSFSTKVGVMDDSGRLRGPTALASPPTRP